MGENNNFNKDWTDEIRRLMKKESQSACTFLDAYIKGKAWAPGGYYVAIGRMYRGVFSAKVRRYTHTVLMRRLAQAEELAWLIAKKDLLGECFEDRLHRNDLDAWAEVIQARDDLESLFTPVVMAYTDLKIVRGDAHEKLSAVIASIDQWREWSDEQFGRRSYAVRPQNVSVEGGTIRTSSWWQPDQQ